MMLTLLDLRAFDPDSRPAQGTARQRFLCPICGDGKPRDDPHRSFDLDILQEVYVCHRCGARGRLGNAGTIALVRRPPPAPSAPKKPWREVIAESGLCPIAEKSPAQQYLQRRAIALETAMTCEVKFAKRWFGRPAVMFPIRDLTGSPVACQGRYIDGRDDPKTRSCGPVKSGAFMTPGCWGRVITLTEAPLDAISLFLMGRPSIATIGCNLPPWLAQATKGCTVFVATDADEAGDAAAIEWSTLLARCGATPRRLRPPAGKDWNDEILRR